MTEEVQATIPVEQKSAEQVQQVEQASSDSTTEQAQVETPETDEEKAKKEPWFQKRIGELTREKYEAKREAETARQEAQQYREHLARVQQGEQSQAPAGDVETRIRQEAQRLIAEQSFNESCNKVYATGKAEFQDFDQAVANLQMVGVSREFLELATTSDAGAKLLHHLGTDLDEAARIATLPPVQMARELTKLEIKLSHKPVKPVSNASAPISPIAGMKGGSSKSPSEMTDSEFAAWRKSQIAQRR